MSGFHSCIIPRGNGPEKGVIGGISFYCADSLGDVVEHVLCKKELPRASINIEEMLQNTPAILEDDFADIRGQKMAKRAA